MQTKLTDILNKKHSNIQEVCKIYENNNFGWTATWLNFQYKFLNLIQFLKKFVDYGFFQINPADFLVFSMDASEIAFIELLLNKKEWCRYNCRNELTIVLDIKEFYKKMRKFRNSKDFISFTMKDCEMITCKVRNFSFQMKNMREVNQNLPSMPPLKYPVKLLFKNPVLFREKISTMKDKLFGVDFKVRNQNPLIHFNTKSSHINDLFNKNIEFLCYTDEDFKLKFKGEYFLKFFSVIIPGKYYLEIGDNMPIRLTILMNKYFDLSSNRWIHNYIKLYIALWSD